MFHFLLKESPQPNQNWIAALWKCINVFFIGNKSEYRHPLLVYTQHLRKEDQRKQNVEKLWAYLEIWKLLLDFGALLSILLQFFQETFFSTVLAFFIHSFVDAFIDLVSLFIIFVIRVFSTQATTIASKLSRRNCHISFNNYVKRTLAQTCIFP